MRGDRGYAAIMPVADGMLVLPARVCMEGLKSNAMNKLETSLTQKGQVTIPLAIRRALGLERGDKIAFELEDGRAILRRSPRTLLAGFGAVTPRQRPEDFRALREEFERGAAADATAATP